MTGNQVQLVSKSSGRALQIVQSSSGQLVVDGMGVIGPEVYNGRWLGVFIINRCARRYV